MLSCFVMGIEGIPFSHRYLKSSLGTLNYKIGVIKFPKTFELKTGFGLRSFPIKA